MSAHDVALSQAYARRNNDELLQIARLITSKPPTNKAGLVQLLVEQTRPARMAAILELVGPDGRAVLAAAAHGNGLLRTALLSRPDFQPGNWEKDWSRQRRPSPILLFFPDEAVMPRHLRARLAQLLPAPVRAPLVTLKGAPPGFIVASDVLTDLGLVLESARAGQLQTTLKGPSAPSLRRLISGLTCPSPHAATDQLRLRCLVTLLTACGWLRDQQRLLRCANGQADHAGLRDLFAYYAAWPYDELFDLDGLRNCHDDYAPISEPRQRRQALLAVLGGCQPGVWIDSAAFSRHAAGLDQIDPVLEECQVSIGRSYEGSMSVLGLAGLQAIREAWVRLVLGCYLAPLGVVEVTLGDLAPLPPIVDGWDDSDDGVPECISQADRVGAFRLTALGLWLLGRGPEPALATAVPGGWRIQADGSVVALGERIAPTERVLLDQLGERLDERSWRLQRDRLMTAIAAGTKASVVRERLLALAGAALPATLDRMIEDAARRAGAITLGPQLLLLSVQDAHAREQLLHDRSTRALCHDCGGITVGVPPDRLADLRRAARKLGWHIPDHHGR